MLTKINQFILSVITLFFLLLTPSIGASYDFATTAKQAIAVEYPTAKVLFEYNSQEKMTPSSMSKLMTLYVAFNKLRSGIIKEDDYYTVSKKAWKIGGSTMFLKHTQRVKVKDLLLGIIVVSGNDACVTLAEGSMGSEEAFVDEMNHMAEKLGLKQSHFTNSSGLPDENHYMSTSDLVKLAIKIYEQFPEYYHLFSEKKFSFNTVTQNNTNTLLLHNENIDGIKTGSTESGGFGIVISAKEGDRRVFVIVNGLKSNQQRNTEAEKLLRYSIANFETKTIFKKDTEIDTLKIAFGDKKTIPLMLDEDLTLTYPKDLKNKILIKIYYNDNLKAPIKKGDKIGYISINVPGEEVKEIAIYSKNDVRELSLFKKILRLFLN